MKSDASDAVGPGRDAILVLIHVLVPIFVGATIYTLWRSPRLLVFAWYRSADLTNIVFKLRHIAAPWRHRLPGSILYSLPDALWVYSFTAALALIWRRGKESLGRRFWLPLPTVMACTAELGQALHKVPGTFDWIDLGSYLLAGLFGSVLLLRTRSLTS